MSYSVPSATLYERRTYTSHSLLNNFGDSQAVEVGINYTCNPVLSNPLY